MNLPEPAPLAFVDEHSRYVHAPPEAVWESLDRYVRRSLLGRPGRLLARVLATEPPAGFALAQRSAPEHLRLVGRHRFAAYALEFDVEPHGPGTIVRARTLATFPGPRGRAYRTVVIGSGGHRVLVRRMLRHVARRSVPA